MSNVQDHPDIEKIAIDTDGIIDGIAVREIIREIFRKPENGKPNDISKAGSLALLRNGRFVWNAWRENYPCPLIAFENKNYANFSGEKITISDLSLLDFGKDALFFKTRFSQDWVEFNFDNNTPAFVIDQRLSFEKSCFSSFVDFSGAIFFDSTVFFETAFENALFVGADFRREVFFDKAIFRGDVDFKGASFSGQVFAGAIFHKDVDFSNCKFKSKISFRNAHFLSSPPKFHGCELHQDTSFEGAVFPPATGDEDAASAYRTLKLAFSKQQAIREEQRFFRLEMEEETLRRTGAERWFFMAYKILSDYGFSVTRPMFFLLVVPFIWMITWYACLSLFELVPTGIFNRELPISTWLAQVSRWSLTSAFSIPGIDLARDLRQSLFGNSVIATIALVLEMLQKILSLTGLFLIGLALRNLFKLK